MIPLLRPALILFTALSIITGIAYPLAVTVLAQVLFPWRSNGSILMRKDGPAGSALIGQEFSGPAYFWARLSATGPVAYTAFNADRSTGSSGSNLGPTNPALVDRARARVEALRAADAAAGYQRPPGQRVPIDLVTSSGSGLDPHVSLAAAEYQAPRIARARGMTEERVRGMVREHSKPRQLGILGEPVVNVLELNLALDAAAR